MTNAEILKTPAGLLTGLDKQRKFLLEMALTPNPCPDCKMEQNELQASGIAINDFKFDSAEPAYRCIRCRRELQHIVPMFSMGHKTLWHWGLK